MGIKHRADSAFRKFSAFSKLGFGRTSKCFEMPYVSYPSRYVPFYRNAPNNDKRTVKENKFAYYMFTYYICTDNFVRQNILVCGQQK